ncbi:hypothetical protein BGP80_11500 [Pseudomonas putida]|uniref:Uncharacterized protein n=1 Tax=Pseudomonas putida TaxID=303 RepID=A0A2S3WC83_PSEPU|nr:hypothetical protein BGP80_11500 [Pseudomonas putida]
MPAFGLLRSLVDQEHASLRWRRADGCGCMIFVWIEIAGAAAQPFRDTRPLLQLTELRPKCWTPVHFWGFYEQVFKAVQAVGYPLKGLSPVAYRAQAGIG